MFDCFALDFEVEAMWFFQLDYMNGWLLNLLMCIDIGLQKPSKYCTLRSDLMRLDVDLAFFAKVITIETLSRDTWGARCASIMTSGYIRILRYLEDTSPGKLIHTVARGSNSGLPLSTGKVLSLKHRKWRSSSSICWLQLSVWHVLRRMRRLDRSRSLRLSHVLPVALFELKRKRMYVQGLTIWQPRSLRKTKNCLIQNVCCILLHTTIFNCKWKHPYHKPFLSEDTGNASNLPWRWKCNTCTLPFRQRTDRPRLNWLTADMNEVGFPVATGHLVKSQSHWTLGPVRWFACLVAR